MYKLLRPLLERNVANEFEKILNEIKPDVVHSFVLYISCTPILTYNEKVQVIYLGFIRHGEVIFIYYKEYPKICERY